MGWHLEQSEQGLLVVHPGPAVLVQRQLAQDPRDVHHKLAVLRPGLEQLAQHLHTQNGGAASFYRNRSRAAARLGG